jgi:fatty-acyl-CoA synthase/fatty acid CoA ligase FadD22
MTGNLAEHLARTRRWTSRRAFLGDVRLGAIAVPVNPMLPAQEHDFLLGDAAPSLVVSDRAILDHFAGTHALSGEELARTLGSATPSPAAPVEGSEPAYAQYTSGTTGKPKAALHRHSDPSCYAAAMAGDVLEMTEDDLVLSVSRSFFAYGLGNTVLFPLFHGAAAVLHPVAPTVEVLSDLGVLASPRLARQHQRTVAPGPARRQPALP